MKTETNETTGDTTTYNYSDAGQLEVVSSANGQTTYTYDKNGNLLT